jgi:hypothetical protein
MPNVIASGTSVVNGTIKRNNFLIGVNTSVIYGPTSSTNFWNGIIPVASGYTVYAQKTVNGPSIRTAANDSELITIAKQYGGTNITTVYDALSYFNSQTNYMVTNIDYPNIVTSGLTLMLDSGYVPSYPKSGSTFNDLSTSSTNGTISGATYSSSNGGLLSFNGTSNYVTLGNPTSLQFDSTTPFSVLGWFYCTSIPSIASIFDKNGSVGGYRMLYGSIWSGQILVTIAASPGAGDAYNATSNVTLSTNTWYHYGFTYDQPTLNLYINGVLDKTFTSDRVLGNTTQSFNIGSSQTGGQYFPGYIPITQVYNRVLTSTEISQNYNAQKSRFGL